MEQTHLIGRTLEKELFIKASPERVFQALTTKEDLERWFLTKAEVDLRPGGTIRFAWEPGTFEVGKILVLEPPIASVIPGRRSGLVPPRLLLN